MQSEWSGLCTYLVADDGPICGSRQKKVVEDAQSYCVIAERSSILESVKDSGLPLLIRL